MIADQSGIILECFGIRRIGAEFLNLFVCHTVFVLCSRHLRHFAVPSGIGLDAEQVETVAAIRHLDFAFSPTALQRSLPQHQLWRYATVLAGLAGERQHAIYKILLGGSVIGRWENRRREKRRMADP